jgi:glycosyltransferase involved in cell wall biosynthesis
VLAPVARRLRRAGVRHLHAHFAAGAALDALRLARLLGLPWSLTAHAYDIYSHPRNLRGKLAAAAFVTSGCDYTVRDLRALMPPGREPDVHEIVMGVDLERFRRAAPYPAGHTVIAVGRLVEKKGFQHLIDALGLLEGSGAVDRLVLVGSGPLEHDLRERAERAGAAQRIDWAGARAPAEVRELLERADLLAMPCVVAADGDRDSMPVVVKEALAMELPVVCSDEVGLPELVRPEWGRLVPPGDPAALAGAIGELLELPAERRSEMGRAGRSFVGGFADVHTETAKLAALIGRAQNGS